MLQWYPVIILTTTTCHYRTLQMFIVHIICSFCSGHTYSNEYHNIHPWDNIALQLRDGAPPSSAGHLAPLYGHLVVVCTSGSAARPLLPWTPRTQPSPRPRWRTTFPVSSTPQAPYTPSSAGVSFRAVKNTHEVSQCLEKASTLSIWDSMLNEHLNMVNRYEIETLVRIDHIQWAALRIYAN